MLFYVQMKWNYQGRLSQDALWDLEAKEGEHALEGVRSGMVKGIYKVVSQHRIIAVVDVPSLEDLDRNSMGWLPMREYLEFEQVWALRDYEGFLSDVKANFPLPPAATVTSARTPREVAAAWFDASTHGRTDEATGLLAPDVEFIDSTRVPGSTDAMPWIGTYRGPDAVKGSFEVFLSVCEPQLEELVELLVDGDEVAGVIHERGVVRATGLSYEIELVQRLSIRDGKIVRCKSYTDPTSILRAIHGSAT